MQNILVAVDFSPVCQAVLDEAAKLARGFGSKLWVLHAAAPEPDFVGYDPGPLGVRDQVAHHLRERHQMVQTMAEQLRETGLDATALLVQGPTTETIVGEAEKLAADLIVVGSHGHGALARAIVGSTSRSLLSKADVPVLVVPASAGEEG
jgi:nucleotide-binding universal stress UspA family protein